MIIKDKTCFSYIVTLCSTFLLVGLVLFYTTVPTLAASNYSVVNDTVYKSADAFGLEELPYGLDTGVIQIQLSSSKWITFYFDRMTVYRQSDLLNIADRGYSNLSDYYWTITALTGGYYNIEILSDSPIYYKVSYDSNSTFSTSVGTLEQYSILTYSQEYSGTSVPIEKKYAVYHLNSSLYNLIGENHQSGYGRIYSNVFMVDVTTFASDNGVPYYYSVKANGPKTNLQIGQTVGYNVEYYPTVEYLQNSQIRSTLVNQWNTMISINDNLDSVLTELYSVNYYLNEILLCSYNVYGLLDYYLPFIETDLVSIIDILNQIKVGPEYDGSQGIGNNNEFGDAFGGLITNDSTPSIDNEKTLVQRNLGDALMFIKLMFEAITARFGLIYLITFLLGLTFISYVLGRVIKNKMHG